MTLLNVCGLSHHYAQGGFSGKHQHQAVLKTFDSSSSAFGPSSLKST